MVQDVVVAEMVDDIKPLVNRVLTQEEQNALESGTVLTLLKKPHQQSISATLQFLLLAVVCFCRFRLVAGSAPVGLAVESL